MSFLQRFTLRAGGQAPQDRSDQTSSHARSQQPRTLWRPESDVTSETRQILLYMAYRVFLNSSLVNEFDYEKTFVKTVPSWLGVFHHNRTHTTHVETVMELYASSCCYFHTRFWNSTTLGKTWRFQKRNWNFTSPPPHGEKLHGKRAQRQLVIRVLLYTRTPSEYNTTTLLLYSIATTLIL